MTQENQEPQEVTSPLAESLEKEEELRAELEAEDTATKQEEKGRQVWKKAKELEMPPGQMDVLLDTLLKGNISGGEKFVAQAEKYLKHKEPTIAEMEAMSPETYAKWVKSRGD